MTPGQIVVIRELDAPIALVFDVLTNPEHVPSTSATTSLLLERR